jgi:lipopolysaccharide transport protein LptA
MKRTLPLAALAVFLALPAPSPAAGALADNGRALESSETATVVTADKLTFDYIRKFAKFENNVVVNDPRMQLSSDHLTILFNEASDPQTIKAEGKVIITHEEFKARSDMATYDFESGRVTLVGGPPQVLKDRNILEGDVILYWTKEQRLECKPHARLVVYPSDFGDADSYFKAPR